MSACLSRLLSAWLHTCIYFYLYIYIHIHTRLSTCTLFIKCGVSKPFCEHDCTVSRLLGDFLFTLFSHFGIRNTAPKTTIGGTYCDIAWYNVIM